MQDKQKITILSQYGAIEQARKFVARAAEAAGLGNQAVFHVQLAVDEACTNIIEHAYEESDKGSISVTCSTEFIQGAPFFLIRLEDQGKPFDPARIPAPKLTSNPDELKIGGLGMHFMRKLMDKIEYHFHAGRNELVMYKRLGQGQT
jgi:serine/threonine-protein kinase RsbW